MTNESLTNKASANGYLAPANRTGRLAERIAARLPHLRFGAWDLSEFLPFFHDVRRTMIFIECENIARSEVMSVIAGDSEFGNCVVYNGERKPKTVNEEWATAKSVDEIRDVIVIVARNDFAETIPLSKGSKANDNIRIPSFERGLVDLLAYSLREWLPIPVSEVVNVIAGFSKEHRLKYGTLSRYATRRYVGWFLNIVLYKLHEKKYIPSSAIDPRHLEAGKRYWEAIKEVENQ
jgi:hypothetical protein